MSGGGGGGVAVGLRVVRGVDWQWQDQDGGEGFVGTVVEVGGHGNSKNPENMAVVVWDTGVRAIYRAGYDGKDDLRVLDSAPTGVRHRSVNCDVCGMKGLHGDRWKCTQCVDYDLCHNCYMSNKHDLSHAFVRYDTPLSVGEQIPKRSSSRTIQAIGVYPGAKVTRGPDWSAKYKDQDGGKGKQGSVLSVGDASDDSSHRSWVKIKWDAGGANDYRRGHDGLIDVKRATAANGEKYYVDHLPKLGDYSNNCFQTGDAVRFNPDGLSATQKAELDNGGVLDLIGRVTVDPDAQSLTIKFPNESSFTVPASCLKKVTVSM